MFFHKLLLVLTLLGFVSCFNVAVANTSLLENEKKLGDLQKEIRSKERVLSTLRKDKQALLQELKQKELEISALGRKVNEVQSAIKEKTLHVQHISQQLRGVEKIFVQHKKALEKQLQAAHAMGEQAFLRLIFSQQDTASSSRIVRYYDYFNKARMQKIEQANQIYQQLNSLKNEKIHEENELQKTIVRLDDEQKALQKVSKQREVLLAKLDKRFSHVKQEHAQLQKDEEQLQKIIARVQQIETPSAFSRVRGPFASLKGKLPWPVKGKIINQFGSARAASKWDGVVIAAREGTNIHAVSSGKVVYADWLRGYGLLTIINHGNNFLTLYAFSETLYKEEGDQVEAGDPIATVGKSGGRSLSALYFGIRKKSKAINPVRWCKKTRRNRVE